MGGAIGEVHGAKLVGLLARGAALRQAAAVLILFDTGGVRLQEANAGELAIAEIMRAVLDARAAGVPVLGLVGGRAGCYGGGGSSPPAAAGSSSRNRAGSAYPARRSSRPTRAWRSSTRKDRALVWRTMGGKHRRLLGVRRCLRRRRRDSFRAAALALLEEPDRFDLDAMKAEQARLELRLERFGACADALDIWTTLGIADATDVPALAAKTSSRWRTDQGGQPWRSMTSSPRCSRTAHAVCGDDGGLIFGSAPLGGRRGARGRRRQPDRARRRRGDQAVRAGAGDRGGGRGRPAAGAGRQRQPAHEQARRAAGPERAISPTSPRRWSSPISAASTPSGCCTGTRPPAPSSPRRSPRARWSRCPARSRRSWTCPPWRG